MSEVPVPNWPQFINKLKPTIGRLHHHSPKANTEIINSIQQAAYEVNKGKQAFLLFFQKPQPWLFLVVNTGTPVLWAMLPRNTRMTRSKMSHHTGWWILKLHIQVTGERVYLSQNPRWRHCFPKKKSVLWEAALTLATKNDISVQLPGRINASSRIVLLLFQGSQHVPWEPPSYNGI